MNAKIWITAIILGILVVFEVSAQNDEGYIYGKLTTTSGNTYVGQIRWGNEELFWHDVFNSIKKYGNSSANPKLANTDNLSEQDNDMGFNWGLFSIWEDRYSGNLHKFSCRFGDIDEIRINDGSTVTLIFKNGRSLKVAGGSNDIGCNVYINDYEIGELKIPWNNILKVDFFDSPVTIKNKFGAPLHGKLMTNNGTFTGMIHWDQDERIGEDILDGYMNGTRVKLQFKNISCIKRDGCKSIVTTKTNNIEILTGTNDVDCSNRGILVTLQDIGIVKVPWDNFKEVCFDHSIKYSGEAYRKYAIPTVLKGRITEINGTAHNGIIVFDKDETWDFEHLEGIYEDNKYIIPFRNIKSILPKNNEYSYVTLKNGKRLLLGLLQDVSSKNEGVIVFNPESENMEYVDWTRIDEIVFE